jgi:VWFA-related protein
MTRLRRRVGVCAGLALVAASLDARAQDAPRFQASVDVTSVDVAVVDNTGKPIVDLMPGDFVVRVDGASRRVVSAQWLSLEAPPVSPSAPVPEGYTSNQIGPGGRLIVLAIDQPSIAFGDSNAVARTAAAFIDTLTPLDRIAVIGFGQGSGATAFLSDFARAKQAVSRMAGQKTTGLSTTFSIGMAEALAVLHGDRSVLDVVVRRECADIPQSDQSAYAQCSNQVEAEVRQAGQEARQQARASLDGLNSLVAALKSIDAAKTIILISEGFVDDEGQARANELGAMTAAARASLYVLQLDGELVDANGGRHQQQTLRDDRLARTDALKALADAARGEVFRVIGSGEAAFARIGSELSGYYLLGLESSPRDRDGKAHAIRVDVPRRGAVVRARRQILSVAAEHRTPQQVVAAGLSSPMPLSGLTLRVGTFALQGPERDRVQMLIHADVGDDYSVARPVSLGYAIFDDSGRTVDARRFDNRLEPVLTGVPSALQVTLGTSLPPGEYTLRLVAAEGDRAGSVDHRFLARLESTDAVTLSELMVGGPVSVRELLAPTIGHTVNFGSVHGYLEAYGSMAEAVTVKYEIAKDRTSSPLLSEEVSGLLAGDERIIFTRVMPVSQLPPGSYVLRARVFAATKPLRTLFRAFEIAPPAVLMASADGSGASPTAPDLFLPVSEQAFSRPFAREDALKPDVLGAFRDRVAPNTRSAFEAGLSAMAAGDYAAAEGHFKAAIQPDVDSTAPMAYVGVTLAARDHDLEAAGAWQTALIDGTDLPQLYDWLSQALLRTHSLPEARAVLEEANGRWPSDARFLGPLAALYATFGKGREAVRLLERHVEQRPDDVESARLAVEWMYQVHAAGSVVHSQGEDTKLARDWAARYGNGPQQALVRQWLEFVER